jgi:2-polyprenyl-3-methyl-5-hydroxy-6-metoxy-1,4-benzoquinol methylase
MDRYYATEYRADYKGAYAPPPRKILRGLMGAQDRLTALRALLAQDDGVVRARAVKLLDVGCGAGELVWLLRRQGIDASGVEPGEEYAGFARRVLGLPIQTATVETALVEPGSCGMVTMFHALEHVPDPRRVLRTVRGWLEPGGLLLVEVPNIEATVQAPSHRFHYAHLYHFTGSTLAALGEAAGVRTVQTFYSTDGGNVSCLFRRETDEERTPVGLEASAARTYATLRRHSTVRHYLTPVPYARAVGRLRRRLREDRLLKRFRTTDGLLRWAAGGDAAAGGGHASGRA